ncbi:MAG: OpgC domain-containing protein [Verrucomicrobia bacterium]|nr:OpgC domain-containing protein [Verrucomicrobiota bacterium]
MSIGPKSGRLIPLDVLRGLMLVFMAVDHIPNALQIATNHVFGFVSAAEGFVFLAGLLAGYVYTRKLRRDSFTIVQAASLRRACQIYGYHLAAYAALFAWTIAFTLHTASPPDNAPTLMHRSPWDALWAGALLVYQPGKLDVLPMYCGLILATPFVLRLLERGWRARILAGSLAAWALTNCYVPQTPFIEGVINTGAFNLGAWQFPFVLGLVFGHAWAREEKILPAPRSGLIGLIVIAAGLLWAVRHAFIGEVWPRPRLDWLTNKNNLAPLRLLDAAMVGYLIYLVIARFPRLLQWRPLAFLGRHSLPVFSVHTVVVGVLLSLPGVFVQTAAGRWLALAGLLGGMFATAGIHHWLTVKRPPAPDRLRTRQLWIARPFVHHGKRQIGAANPVHR